MDKIFFDNWQSILRTVIITVLAYVALVAMLRVSGKRTLSKMNAFDLIVTFAIGSALATVALNKSVALADGVLAFLLFIGMQFVITSLSVRHKWVKRIITSRPTLLLYKGEVLNEVIKKERITIQELYLAARQQGIHDLQDIDAMILESTGDITVIKDMRSAQHSSLKDVEGKADTI